MNMEIQDNKLTSWEAIRAFLKGKITKQELDTICKTNEEVLSEIKQGTPIEKEPEIDTGFDIDKVPF